MFEFIRTHQRLMQFFLFLIVGPLFIVGGLQIRQFTGTEDAVAKVGDKVISEQELDNALRDQNPQMTSIPGIKKEVLDQLINEHAMTYEAFQDQLSPSQQDIAKFALKTFPQLNGLPHDEQAKLYAQYAAAQGMSIDGFEAKVRRFLILQRTQGEIQSTAFAPKAVATRIADIIEQERDVQQMPVKIADYTSQVKVTDDMLKAYYNKNLAQFQVPEQAKIEYVVLSIDNIAQQITISDADAQKYYQDNPKQFTSEEQRRASHILIKVAKDANDAAKAAAKAKAEKLLADVRKNPADFAKLAKENSEDPGSAEKGGDLDYFARGLMVKPFQDAVDKMKVGEISDLVQSDFGYHIITLTGIKPPELKPFDTVKADIVAELKKKQATAKFSELRETFSNTVFEQADSLKPVVDKLAAKTALKIETAANVTRKPDPNVAPNVSYNSQKFLTALFSDDSIKKKQNTEATEVSPGTLISGRITEYKPVTQKTFEEVQAAVRETVIQAEARKLAEKAADDKIAALKTKDDATGFGDSQTISRAKSMGLNPVVLQAVMKADASKLPAFVKTELPGVGYAVYRINKVGQPANPDAARADALKRELGQVVGRQEMAAYVEAVKAKAKVKILRPDVLTAPTTSASGGGAGEDGQ
jgi:peptidyl-prolyl cis-trans isomerase D